MVAVNDRADIPSVLARELAATFECPLVYSDRDSRRLRAFLH